MFTLHGRQRKILKTVDAGQRLSEKDFVWLSAAAEEYFSDELRAAYHRLEAAFFANEFKQKRDPWLAVNASSHFRKADYSDEAASLLKTIKLGKIKSTKLKSALCTTHGGSMRDLGHWDEGLSLGEQAHKHRPDDYRPCTLLGAIYMEKGDYTAWVRHGMPRLRNAVRPLITSIKSFDTYSFGPTKPNRQNCESFYSTKIHIAMPG